MLKRPEINWRKISASLFITSPNKKWENPLKKAHPKKSQK